MLKRNSTLNARFKSSVNCQCAEVYFLDANDPPKLIEPSPKKTAFTAFVNWRFKEDSASMTYQGTEEMKACARLLIQ